jgi:hypothetical protein
MGSLLLPETDTAVIAEALIVFPLIILAGLACRRDRAIRLLVAGLFIFTLGCFVLRALH